MISGLKRQHASGQTDRDLPLRRARLWTFPPRDRHQYSCRSEGSKGRIEERPYENLLPKRVKSEPSHIPIL